jgi:hypothetical protein
MSPLQRIITATLFCIALTACSDGNDTTLSLDPNPYEADELWLCKPNLANNHCLDLDQTTTYVYSDNSQAVFEHTPAADPQFDCFYVYPTRDYRARSRVALLTIFHCVPTQLTPPVSLPTTAWQPAPFWICLNFRHLYPA